MHKTTNNHVSYQTVMLQLCFSHKTLPKTKIFTNSIYKLKQVIIKILNYQNPFCQLQFLITGKKSAKNSIYLSNLVIMYHTAFQKLYNS